MFSSNYFIDWLSILVAIAVVIVGILNFKKLGLLKIFVIYALLSSLQTGVSKAIVYYDIFKLKQTPFIELSFISFVAFEAILFFIFYFNTLNTEYKKVAIIVSLVLASVYVWDIASHGTAYFIPDFFTIAEGTGFLFLSVLFYVQLFSDPPLSILVASDIFWTANGIFLLFALVLPVFLLKPVISSALPSIQDGLYSFNYIAYTIFFFCILKAILCKIKAPN